MNPGELAMIVATEEHLLHGTATSHGRRLLDVVNDANSSFLSLRNVQVFRRGGGPCIATLREAGIRKSGIGLAVPASKSHEAPQKRCHNFVPKNVYDTFLLVMGYEVRGRLHLQGTKDPVVALCNELGDFFPVARGTVSSTDFHWPTDKAQVVVVNSAYVSLFQIASPTTERSADMCLDDVRAALRTL